MATIRDVARSAGVSIATVSRVFNDSPKVSEDARSRVWTAAATLDYWPNSAARSLTTSRTHALGVLLPDLFGEFFSEVIRGIDQAARESRFQILVSSSHADTEELLQAARAMRGRIDGLIAMAPEPRSFAAIESIAAYFPLVLINPCASLSGSASVATANREGALSVVRHLLELGHRSIGILKGPDGNVDGEERLAGYRAALEEAGVAPDPDLEFDGDFTEAAGYRLGRRLAARRRRPRALFAANDSMAIGFMSALRDGGVAVPDSIAVAGFDDIALARYVNPSLTTVRVDAYDLGRMAVGAWIAQVAETSGSAPDRILVPTSLVVRQSCGAPRRRNGSPPGGRRAVEGDAIAAARRAARRAGA